MVLIRQNQVLGVAIPVIAVRSVAMLGVVHMTVREVWSPARIGVNNAGRHKPIGSTSSRNDSSSLHYCQRADGADGNCFRSPKDK